MAVFRGDLSGCERSHLRFPSRERAPEEFLGFLTNTFEEIRGLNALGEE